MTEVAHLPRLSPAAERMRRYAAPAWTVVPFWQAARVSPTTHHGEGSCKWDCPRMLFRTNHLLTLRTTQSTWSAR